MGLSHEEVLQILALLDASDFDELRLETNEYKLHVRRSAPLPPANGAPAQSTPAASFAAAEPAAQSAPAAPPATRAAPATIGASAAPAAPAAPAVPSSAPAMPVSAASASSASASSTPASAAHAPAAGSLVEVKTPLLGTFYRAPQPGAAPFVEIGSTVEVHTVIGIIEVMKLMSSVAAGVIGTVAEIDAKDGQLVEYGEVLMRIAPRGA